MTLSHAKSVIYGDAPTCANEFYAAHAYLTAERIASHKQYLADVAAGMDAAAAWKLHKARMAA